MSTAADKHPISTKPLTPWLTASEAAAYLKVKPRTLLRWVRQGKVKAFALSGTKRRVWRFRQQDLDASVMESPVLCSSAPTVLSPLRSLGARKEGRPI